MTVSNGKTPTGLDEAVRMFAGYVRGENGFDELDFKEWLIEWHNKQVEAVLDRLGAQFVEEAVVIFGKTEVKKQVPLSAIKAERNRLKESN